MNVVVDKDKVSEEICKLQFISTVINHIDVGYNENEKMGLSLIIDGIEGNLASFIDEAEGVA